MRQLNERIILPEIDLNSFRKFLEESFVEANRVISTEESSSKPLQVNPFPEHKRANTLENHQDKAYQSGITSEMKGLVLKLSINQ